MTETGLSDFERKILANIEQHGCQVNQVFDPKENEPNFCYSIGFPKSVGQPEVIVFGLDLGLMKSMINEIYAQCAKGLVLQNGLRVADLIEGFECELRRVDPVHISDDFFASAIWYERYRSGTVMDEAFQVVWPGANSGLFPWESAEDSFVVRVQPRLYTAEGAIH